jgi:hypothetical protein
MFAVTAVAVNPERVYSVGPLGAKTEILAKEK